MRSLLVLVSVWGLVQGLARIDPLVKTKSGLIRGLQSKDGFAEFLGVPYAVVDEKNPFGQSKPHPGFEDIFDAFKSNECPQIKHTVAIGTIDCLSLNIYVPKIADSQRRLPVMVWVHGGGFTSGSAGGDGFSPKFLVRNDVIVVSINYRLGAYGFMCLNIPEIPGNQGLKDQVLALRWINENIEAFGGNPKEITVFGQSAGGVSVNLHILSSYEKLFDRAIIQSGAAVTPIWSRQPDNTFPIQLAQSLGFNTSDIYEALESLSTVDARTVIRAATNLGSGGAFPISNILLSVPCIEKKFDGIDNFISEHPRDIVSPKASTTEVIIGYNDNEGAMGFELANDEFYKMFNFGDLLKLDFDFGNSAEKAADAVRHFYIGDEIISRNVKQQLSDFIGDISFGYPTKQIADQLLRDGASTVYLYIFSYSGGRNYMKVPLNLNSTGAAHADELGYLFDYAMFPGEPSPDDQLMIDRMTTIWTNFAKFGDPTPEKTDLLPIKWNKITKTAHPYLDINLDIPLGSRPTHSRNAFWDLFFDLYEKYQI